MKKLIIAVAMIALAITTAQAAHYKWSFTGTKASISGTKFDGATVYMVLADDLATYLSAHGNKIASASDIQGMSTSQGTLTVGSMSATTGAIEVKCDDEGNVPWYAFVIDGDTYYQSKSVTTSVAVADKQSPTAKQYSSTTELLNPDNFVKFSGTDPTPEPTSGLLLLLGVAGLALRRRRA